MRQCEPFPPFRRRCGRFDWKLLHGVGLRSISGAAIERLVDTLVTGDIKCEPALAPSNYCQLVSLLQYAVQYTQYVGSCLKEHASQLQQCCRLAAKLQDALLQLSSSGAEQFQAPMPPCCAWQAHEEATQAERSVVQLRQAYSSATQAMQASPQPGWRPVPPACLIDWRLCHSLDVEHDIYLNPQHGRAQLQHLLPMLAAGNPTGSESNDAGFALEQQNIFQLVQLLQCSLDLVLHQAEVAHAEKDTAQQQWRAAYDTVEALSRRREQLFSRLETQAKQQQQQQYSAARLQDSQQIACSMGMDCSRPPGITSQQCCKNCMPAGTKAAAGGYHNQAGTNQGSPSGNLPICGATCSCQTGLSQSMPALHPLFIPAAFSAGPSGERCEACRQRASLSSDWPGCSQTGSECILHSCACCCRQGREPMQLGCLLQSQARPPSPLAQRLQGAPAPGTGSAVRQLADCIEDSISQERRRGLELSLALREVRASVIRLQQANQCRAGAAIPSSPPAVAEPCPSSDVRSEPSEEVNCVGLEEAVVRRQAEAQLRFQIEEIKKKAFQEAQVSFTPRHSRCATPVHSP